MEIHINERFGKLTVIEQVKQKSYLCKCDCGNKRIFQRNELLRGNNKSCGCIWRKHEMTGTKPYQVWQNMKRRCNDPKNKSYKDYGGRGITYCDKWKTFDGFWEDMQVGYSESLTLDRIEVDGNYTKDNCRWVDKEVQANNTRTNRMITYKGETLSMSLMARKYNMETDLLKGRLYKGWTVEEAIETPVEYEILTYNGETKTVSDWAKEKGFTYIQLKKRLMRGWTVERALTQPIRKPKK